MAHLLLSPALAARHGASRSVALRRSQPSRSRNYWPLKLLAISVERSGEPRLIDAPKCRLGTGRPPSNPLFAQTPAELQEPRDGSKRPALCPEDPRVIGRCRTIDCPACLPAT